MNYLQVYSSSGQAPSYLDMEIYRIAMKTSYWEGEPLEVTEARSKILQAYQAARHLNSLGFPAIVSPEVFYAFGSNGYLQGVKSAGN